MINREVRVAWLERELRREETYVALREAYGEDVYEDSTVIAFEVTHARAAQVGNAYSYAAIKVNGLWYRTGTISRPAWTWDQMITWLIDRDVPTTEIQVVTEWGTI